MNNNNLSPSEKEALLYIVEHGPTYAYHLGDKKEKIFKTEKTANTALNNLARKSLLEKKGTEGQRDKKNYYLTLKGLCKVFANSDDSDRIWEKIETITGQWGDLLPLLKKYNLFKKHGLEKEMRTLLIRASNMLTMNIELGLLCDADSITLDLIERSMHRADADFMLKWNKVLQEDSELRNKTKFRLLLERDSLRSYLTEIETRLSEVFPKLENSKPDWIEINTIELNLQRAHITKIATITPKVTNDQNVNK